MYLTEILFYVISGFIAQLVDGAIGMGYGVMSTTLLISGGFGPALASGCAHVSEVFTTGVSGASHSKLGNVRREIVLPLAISGIIGGAIGATLCVTLSVKSPAIFTILVAILLEDMGVLTLYRFWIKKGEPSTRPPQAKQENKDSEPRLKPEWLSFLGLFSSFTDSIGGGGWGPVATPAIVLEGVNPRKVVGSINLTEFFVTMVQGATFVFLLPTMRWDVVVALLVGGVVAAPFAALLCKKLPMRTLGILIGMALIILSTRNIFKAAGLI